MERERERGRDVEMIKHIYERLRTHTGEQVTNSLINVVKQTYKIYINNYINTYVYNKFLYLTNKKTLKL